MRPYSPRKGLVVVVVFRGKGSEGKEASGRSGGGRPGTSSAKRDRQSFGGRTRQIREERHRIAGKSGNKRFFNDEIKAQFLRLG